MIAARIPKGSGLKPVPWTVMVNPVITPLVDDTVPVWERCLSIPGLHGQVPRYPRVTVGARLPDLGRDKRQRRSARHLGVLAAT
jgi:peptide deformylase